MAIDNYTSLVTSQHATKPKFMQWLSTALNIVNDGMECIGNMDSQFDVDSAIGIQLDIIGQIVGLSRKLTFQPIGMSPTMDDDNYRLALKAKISINRWDGSISKIYDIWNVTFQNLGLLIVDNQDMTFKALISNVIDDNSQELISNGLIIPKPFGVKVVPSGLSVATEQAYQAMVITSSDICTVITTM